MKFTYILCGCEETTSNLRILKILKERILKNALV